MEGQYYRMGENVGVYQECMTTQGHCSQMTRLSWNSQNGKVGKWDLPPYHNSWWARYASCMQGYPQYPHYPFKTLPLQNSRGKGMKSLPRGHPYHSPDSIMTLQPCLKRSQAIQHDINPMLGSWQITQLQWQPECELGLNWINHSSEGFGHTSHPSKGNTCSGAHLQIFKGSMYHQLMVTTGRSMYKKDMRSLQTQPKIDSQ